MKKHLIIFSLIFSVLTGFAQNIDTGNPETNDSVDSTTTEKPCPHRINFYLGGSMTNNIFNRIDNDLARTNYSLGSVLEVKYAYFFNKNWRLWKTLKPDGLRHREWLQSLVPSYRYVAAVIISSPV
ncbi:hypothetical protein LJC67_07635 [Bacteroidales bacterium OttesenSCG-928-A14]|nr:hypothetical protein [Bacteroidales bacterium OttesenSCG-928-A14]